jgi:error-prone DNA polymerase
MRRTIGNARARTCRSERPLWRCPFSYSRKRPPEWLPHQQPAEPPRLTLLCASQTGYQNLCQLITRFKMRESIKTEGAATLEDIEEFATGLICLTGGDEGPLAAALAQDGQDSARELADRLSSIFGRGNLYFWSCSAINSAKKSAATRSLLSLASDLHLPVIATNGVRYATHKDREILDVFTSIRHHTTLEKAGPTAYGERSTSCARQEKCLRSSATFLKPLPTRAS